MTSPLRGSHIALALTPEQCGTHVDSCVLWDGLRLRVRSALISLWPGVLRVRFSTGEGMVVV